MKKAAILLAILATQPTLAAERLPEPKQAETRSNSTERGPWVIHDAKDGNAIWLLNSQTGVLMVCAMDTDSKPATVGIGFVNVLNGYFCRGGTGK